MCTLDGPSSLWVGPLHRSRGIIRWVCAMPNRWGGRPRERKRDWLHPPPVEKVPLPTWHTIPWPIWALQPEWYEASGPHGPEACEVPMPLNTFFWVLLPGSDSKWRRWQLRGNIAFLGEYLRPWRVVAGSQLCLGCGGDSTELIPRIAYILGEDCQTISSGTRPMYIAIWPKP